MTYIQDATGVERKEIAKVFIEKMTLPQADKWGIPLGDEEAVKSVLQSVQRTVCICSRNFQQTRIAMFV